ncbi:MAG: alpha-amylase [Bacteroidaceae bacterium]|nr:alpha-amylase [Bacteroidaceae bacterium]
MTTSFATNHSVKPIIYQVLPRLFGNREKGKNILNGTLQQNGSGKLSAFTLPFLRRLRNDGYTHIWYTGLLRHATQTDYSSIGIPRSHPVVVKGKAGSPYAIADYYDIDPDLSDCPEQRQEEFDKLVARTHKVGLKFIMDFVPNHVARQYHSIAAPKGIVGLGSGDNTAQAFSPQNNFYYIPDQCFHTDGFAPGSDYQEQPARVTGNDCFHAFPSANDWYETIKLNYGVDYLSGGRTYFQPLPSTWLKMTEILLHWASRGVDAFRCDMAEMVPVAFWQYAIAEVKKQYPQVQFIAEVYNPERYRDYIHQGGFDYLYDKVGLYDTLRAIVQGTKWAADITPCWQATSDIADHMLHFLENHDEQRIASDFFAGNAQAGVPAFFVAALMNKAAVMLYSGQEVGEPGMEAEGFSGLDGRTTIFDYWRVNKICRRSRGLTSLSKEERSLYEQYATITRLCSESEIVREGTFFDLMYANFDHPETFNASRHYAFLRSLPGKGVMLCVANFSSEPHEVEVRIPAHAFDFAQLQTGTCQAQNPISDEMQSLTLIPDGFVSIKVPAYGGSILLLPTSKNN